MKNEYEFNQNLQYPSLDLLKPSHNDNILKNININQIFNDNNSKSISSSNKQYIIKVTKTDLYIENKKSNSIIRIPKSFNHKIFILENEYEYKNMEILENYQADSIIGIFDLNSNKYLAVVTSAKVAAKVLGSFIFNIISIELIKITLNNESNNDINFLKEIKNLFLTKNFYFSNDFDLSLSLYNQYKIKSYDYNGNNNNKKQLKSNYLINSSLLKYFADNNIPESFYSTIIYGYVGCKIDVDLDEINKDLAVDIIVIERYYKKNIVINRDIPEHVKQIELICTFKEKINKTKKTFSFVFYLSSESMKNISEFDPCKSILIEELEQYKNITCIINNLNNYNEKNNLKNALFTFNESFFNNKIQLIDFTSDWDKNLYFDTNNDSYNFINFYLNNSFDEIQKNVFWFIDINNYFSDDDCCFNTFIRFMWRAIQKQINYLKLNIDIGLFNKNNNNYICKKYKEIIMKYHNDLDENKKSIYNNMNRNNIQETLNNCFCSIIQEKTNNTNNIHTFRNNDKYKEQNNIYNNKGYNTSRNNYNNESNNNDFSKKEEYDKNVSQKKNVNENINLKKVKILCITWNIAGIPYESDYNITELFTQNIFYHKNAPPDIIVVAIQEIIKLSIISVLSIVSNQENVKAWTDNILYTVDKVFPNTKYYQLKCMDLVGIYIMVLIKSELKNDIYLLDSNTTKTGVYGTMGNKGFFTLTLKCYDNLISFGSGHFEAGQSKNDDRIETLNLLLNKPINITDDSGYLTFKDIENWIILGDLNFRINLDYEDAYILIREKKYDVLYGLDQFNSVKEHDKFLNDNINENEIRFDPTYKYVKGSNEYAYDEDKIRVPAWTDRIFYSKKKSIKMLTYDSIKNIKYSDHRPVIGTFLVKCYNNKRYKSNIKENLYNDNNQIKNKENKEDLIDLDHNIIKEIKANNNYIKDNNISKSSQYNKSKNIKNEQQNKMNYRGIKFNTEIDIDMNNNFKKNEKQDIYQFFEDKSKNKNNNNNHSYSNLIFNDIDYNNPQKDNNLINSSFNENNNINNNQNIFSFFNENNQQKNNENFGRNNCGNNYQKNFNIQNNIQNLNNNNNIYDFFQ